MKLFNDDQFNQKVIDLVNEIEKNSLDINQKQIQLEITKKVFLLLQECIVIKEQ